MKIFFYISQLSAGGAEQVAVLLAKGLLAINHEVVIVTAKEGGEFLIRVPAECKVISLQSKKPIRATSKLAKLIKIEHPDIVLCFGFVTGISAGISKFFFRWKCPLVIRNENNLKNEWSIATPLNKLIGPVLSAWIARRNTVLAVTEELSDATDKYFRFPPGRTKTILNPVLDELSEITYHKHNNLHPLLTNSKSPVFVAMGRLESQKGFDILIKAFAKVVELHSAYLVIFGKGTLEKKLQNQINDLGVSEYIELAGLTNYPIEQMKAAHAFVLSSRFEGFGLVLIEALWAETKVISTNCDFGPSELLERGRYGVLVPTDDVTALAEAIINSIEKPWLAEKPRKDWFNKFTATESARLHAALFESLLVNKKL